MNIRLLQVAVAVLLLGYPLLLLRFRAAKARLETEAKEAFMRGTQHLAEECAFLRVEIERARDVADGERAKTARYFAKISDFERERTTWQTSYYEQSLGHGNAQQLMMNTIETLAKQLQAAGIQPRIPNVIFAVREEFVAQHEQPSRDALAAIEAAKLALSQQPTVSDPPQVAVPTT